MRHSGQAFGLQLSGDVELAPIVGSAEASWRSAVVERATRATVDSAWEGGARRLIAHVSPEAIRPSFTVDRGTDHYRVWAAHHGCYLVSMDGTRALCAPPRGPNWRWQRLLVAQVLPLLATLQGMHLLHASAVADGQGALAILGRSGSGKTSVAAQLVARGFPLMADDVLAVDAGSGVSYAGAQVARLHYNEFERLPDGVGEIVAEGEKAHVRLQRMEDARPLSAVYTIAPDPRALTIAVEPLRVTPALILGSAYPTYTVNKAHAERQLAGAASLSRFVKAHRVVTPTAVASSQVADAIAAHARSRAGSA